jgi:N-carbamoyl-L-amino-acid hydrolase
VNGSHLDTQPTGGRYDGILGVLAGIEVIKTMNDMGLDTTRDHADREPGTLLAGNGQ